MRYRYCTLWLASQWLSATYSDEPKASGNARVPRLLNIVMVAVK